MKTIVCVLVLAAAFAPSAAFAATPDSIGGKVYRQKLAIASLRGANEMTILFGNDGRFILLKDASVNFVSEDWAHGSLLIRNPPGDGAFVYAKTGESTAQIDLNYDSGSTYRLPLLTFTSAWSGDSSGGLDSFPYWTFSFADLATIDTAPALNVSTRGHIAPGQPMIVGFIVPGTRGPEAGVSPLKSPDANARDVLIRVVGPSLAQFGVAGVCADPDFKIYRGNIEIGTQTGRTIHYGDWSIIDRSNGGMSPLPNSEGVLGFKKIFNYVSAFPLIDGSKDAVDVQRLGPGAYTVVAYPAAGDPGGEVLVEVYFLP